MTFSSLTFRLPAVFMLSVMVLFASYTAFFLTDMRRTLVQQAGASLEMATQRAADRIEHWFQKTERTLILTAQSRITKDSTRQVSVMVKAMGDAAQDYLRTTYVDGNPYLGADRDQLIDAMDRTAYSSTHAKMHDHFRTLRKEHGFQDVYLFDSLGNVIYSVTKQNDLGQNALTGDFAKTGLASAFTSAMQAAPDAVVFTDFAPYGFAGNLPASFMATGIFDDKSNRIGVLAIRIPATLMGALLQGDAAGAEGYAFALVGSDGSYRFEDERHKIGQSEPRSPQLDAAIAGQSGLMQETVNAQGVDVFAAYHPVAGVAPGWTVVAEAERAAILAPFTQKAKVTLLASGAVACILAGIGLFLGRWIAHPLQQLATQLAAISQHTPVSIMHQSRSDEVGDLARGLDRFRRDQDAAHANRVENLFKGKAFNTTATAMMIADAEGKLLFLNDAALQMFRTNCAAFRERFPGFDPETLIGTNISIFHRDHHRNMRMLQDPSNRKMEADIAIGAQIFALQIAAVEDDETRVGYVVVWESVRERRRTNTILSTLDAAQVIIEISPQGLITDINDFGLAAYEYQNHREELIGQPLAKLFVGGEAAATSALQKTMMNGSLAELHNRKTRSGKDIWVLCALNVIRNGAGQIVSVVGICTDQTATVLARIQQEESARLQAEDQQAVVDALGRALAALSQGDMRASISTEFPAQYQVLKDNFNEALESLNQTLRQVARASDTILSSAGDIATSASELSQRTESQAATLEQTAAALDALTTNVRATTSGTISAGSMVTSAHDAAQNNAEIVRHAVDAMGAIEASSQKIATIISLIDDIAFQTNLLALNAGVEAARAGDAGRGFAVVAAEVRALAQRSSIAASEIKDLISQSGRQVASGATVVTKSGEAVSTIVADMSEINGIVAGIAKSTQEQASGLTEINSGITLLDRVTQQNAAMVDQSIAQSARLKNEATELSNLLHGFTLAPEDVRPLRSNAA
jgi:methyl-accepting chemotaxis protein